MPENKEIINEIENFVIRVLRGGKDVHPQETAILPDVLRILIDNEEKAEQEPQQIDEALARRYKEPTCLR